MEKIAYLGLRLFSTLETSLIGHYTLSSNDAITSGTIDKRSFY